MDTPTALPALEFDAGQLETLQNIGNDALAIATRRYGSGFPEFSGGVIRKLGFNNARHDRMVGNDAARLARYVGLQSAEQELARITGYAHDVVQLKGRGTDERESAAWIKKQLEVNNHLPAIAADMASKAIIATEPIFRDGIVTGQKVDHIEFASEREALFAHCVVSADLSELYSPMGPYLSHSLYTQLLGYEPGEEPPLDGLMHFQEKQIILLEGYHYPLKSAEVLFGKYRQDVIGYHAWLIEELVRGNVTTWQQLLALDLDFMAHPDTIPAGVGASAR